MFRRFTDRLNSAASSVMVDSRRVQTLTSLGFDSDSATNALHATNGDVDRAAELLLAQAGVAANSPVTHQQDDEATLHRVMQESLELEERRRLAANPTRTAATHKAGEAAALRAKGKKPVSSFSAHHPDVKIIPRMQDKSKEEQILRCADRLRSHPQAVDTLHRALTAIQSNPDSSKLRKVDKTTAGYKRSLENVPGAEDLMLAMNFRQSGTHALVLDRAMVDPALLYLGISALEQIKLTPEYKLAKRKAIFEKAVQEVRLTADTSEMEAIERADFMSKCPSEPDSGRGALMQVKMANETVRRRFDGDDTLMDVLNWLGGHGSVIPGKIFSREWSLVDLNRYPSVPIDCEANKGQTLQYIGCWPSGKLEIVPSTDEWEKGMSSDQRPGSSRGLGSAPSDVL